MSSKAGSSKTSTVPSTLPGGSASPSGATATQTNSNRSGPGEHQYFQSGQNHSPHQPTSSDTPTRADSVSFPAAKTPSGQGPDNAVPRSKRDTPDDMEMAKKRK